MEVMGYGSGGEDGSGGGWLRVVRGESCSVLFIYTYIKNGFRYLGGELRG